MKASPARRPSAVGSVAASSAAGSAGAPGLCAVTFPRASADQRNTGAESASMSPRSTPWDGPGRVTRWLSAAGSYWAALSRAASRASVWSVMCRARTRLNTTAPIT